MILYILVGFLWFAVLMLYCQMLRLNRFATETIENLRTLNQLVLKQTGEQGNGVDDE